MTRQPPPPTLTAPTPSLDAGRRVAISVASSALDEDHLYDEDDHVVFAASGGMAMKFSANGTAGVGTSIWSSKEPGFVMVRWENKAEPLDIGVHGHKRTVSLGGAVAMMGDRLANGENRAAYDMPPFTSFNCADLHVRPPAIRSSPTSLPTSPTGFPGLADPFDTIPGNRYGAHMLSRSASPPRTSSSLSARAAPFEVSPRPQVRLQSSPGRLVGHVLPPRRCQPQVIPPRQQRIQQQQQSAFNFPDEIRARPMEPTVAAVPRPTHGRTRSDLAHRFNADLPIVHEATTVPTVQITHEPASIPSPPPRSLTPQPYHRPSIVVREPVEQDWFKAWKRRLGGPPVPSLAECREMLIAAGRIDPTAVPARSTRSISAGRAATMLNTSNETETSPKAKRYSLDSNSSSSSMQSSGTAASTDSTDNSSVPATPHKSRFFPAFLQDRLTDSACSSPTQASFSANRSKGGATNDPICPALRVTPPPPETSRQVSPTESQYRDIVRILNRIVSEVDTTPRPMITCTPPTASGAWIDLNEDSEHTAIRGQNESAADVARREERGRLMINKLKRRSHPVPA